MPSSAARLSRYRGTKILRNPGQIRTYPGGQIRTALGKTPMWQGFGPMSRTAVEHGKRLDGGTGRSLTKACIAGLLSLMRCCNSAWVRTIASWDNALCTVAKSPDRLAETRTAAKNGCGKQSIPERRRNHVRRPPVILLTIADFDANCRNSVVGTFGCNRVTVLTGLELVDLAEALHPIGPPEPDSWRTRQPNIDPMRHAERLPASRRRPQACGRGSGRS